MEGNMAQGRRCYMGLDVGTASVRAALVAQDGSVLAQAEEPIHIWEPHPEHYEQSSADIWAACCTVSKKVVENVNINSIQGLGFDATCSLVVLDDHFEPLAVNDEGVNSRNIIMWMDHRAVDQVSRINQVKYSVLKYVGGVMSPEMQPPKLMWLKEKLQDICWNRAAHFFDLPDFLSWKATGATTRSLCTLVCKWTYSADKGWDDCFWKKIGLKDLTVDNYAKIGNHVLSPGTRVDSLATEAAHELGLPEGIAVAVSLIDAHAGSLGVIGADVKGHNLPCEMQPITSRLALICGTSSCHMGISENPIFVPGVWGPYYSAMVPGFWLNEGGQSATGKLVTGLGLTNSLDDLAKLYLASVQAIALGTRHILEAMQKAGHQINTLFMCGGLSKNPLFVQMHADISGMPVVLAEEVESVLVGAAILGACASGDFNTIQEAMEKMGKVGKVIWPNLEDKRFYDKKYEVFLKLAEHQREYRNIMQNV
ncbi:FGGY carbohydrate kinase domain-containing protein isoform X2 [Callorhinchus milii]|uniref:FGGY carbohydrate kinase domain-containing protein isoform X2 n=1 Tax=Callorhinchus milii TaxID=7868 RepID=UPI001C3FDAFC|nr:FGGY carbohydrate kinase domain-containing protein isoform X2 [Callorhinchus milii]